MSKCSLHKKQISSVGELREQYWQWSHVLFASFLISIIFSLFFPLSLHRAEQKTHRPRRCILVLACISFGSAYRFGNRSVKLETANVTDGEVRRFLAAFFVILDGAEDLDDDCWLVDRLIVIRQHIMWWRNCFWVTGFL